MPNLITSIPFEKIEKIKLVKTIVANESIVDVSKRVNCDYAINGGDFNLATLKPGSWAVADKEVLGTGYSGFGFAFVENRLPVWSYCNNRDADNFIGCFNDYYNAQALRKYNPEIPFDTSIRGRTAIGINEDSFVIGVATDSDVLSMGSQIFLRYLVEKFNCIQVINLDGGASSQFFMSGKQYVHDTRRPPYYICIWLTKDLFTRYYRVQAGSWTSRANADNAVDKLKAIGYDAFITIYDKPEA